MLHPTLAAGGFGELVFIAIVVVAGWIYNGFKKWMERQQATALAPPADSAGQLEQSVEAAKQRLQREQAQRQQQVAQAAGKQGKKAKKQARRAAAAVSAAPPIATVAAAGADEAVVSPKPLTSRVTPATLHTWLTPATLRQQFVLTEILNPPKALRSETYP